MESSRAGLGHLFGTVVLREQKSWETWATSVCLERLATPKPNNKREETGWHDRPTPSGLWLAATELFSLRVEAKVALPVDFQAQQMGAAADRAVLHVFLG